ncbi:MAG: hypothetical protein QM730_12930 [Anaerolineales bacterium]
MKTFYKFVLILFPLLAWFGSLPFQLPITHQDNPSPTPTYDPLVETPLPENPTEFELGQNLYWHWCMPCHGDKGQGLTDEFRGIWEPEHQNCWGRGCHAGRREDQGFPIPTVVPALVNDAHLSQFLSVQGLTDYLQATYPPQSPGILKAEEYHAIALFVFTMNGRSLVDIHATEIPALTPTPTQTQIPHQENRENSFPVYAVFIFAMLLVGIFVLAKRTRIQE